MKYYQTNLMIYNINFKEYRPVTILAANVQELKEIIKATNQRIIDEKIKTDEMIKTSKELIKYSYKSKMIMNHEKVMKQVDLIIEKLKDLKHPLIISEAKTLEFIKKYRALEGEKK